MTDERVSSPAQAFELSRAWKVHPQVALRDESFGALAYHYGTRRLLFLKSRPLVDLVSSLARFETAGAAIDALIVEADRPRYGRALARLAASEVIVAD
ncbi:MAG TPA: mycofactocin biosynthesis chaperone MftB [Acidimicrobiales bacterium]